MSMAAPAAHNTRARRRHAVGAGTEELASTHAATRSRSARRACSPGSRYKIAAGQFRHGPGCTRGRRTLVAAFLCGACCVSGFAVLIRFFQEGLKCRRRWRWRAQALWPVLGGGDRGRHDDPRQPERARADEPEASSWPTGKHRASPERCSSRFRSSATKGDGDRVLRRRRLRRDESGGVPGGARRGEAVGDETIDGIRAAQRARPWDGGCAGGVPSSGWSASVAVFGSGKLYVFTALGRTGWRAPRLVLFPCGGYCANTVVFLRRLCASAARDVSKISRRRVGRCQLSGDLHAVMTAILAVAPTVLLGVWRGPPGRIFGSNGGDDSMKYNPASRRRGDSAARGAGGGAVKGSSRNGSPGSAKP